MPWRLLSLPLLRNLAPPIRDQQRYSRIYQGREDLVDNLLVSRALVDRMTRVTTGDVAVGSIGDNPNERRDKPASDHRPAIATLATA